MIPYRLYPRALRLGYCTRTVDMTGVWLIAMAGRLFRMSRGADYTSSVALTAAALSRHESRECLERVRSQRSLQASDGSNITRSMMFVA